MVPTDIARVLACFGDLFSFCKSESSFVGRSWMPILYQIALGGFCLIDPTLTSSPYL
jgi:hypothetical protein